MQIHIHSLKGYTQNATNASLLAAASPTLLCFRSNVQIFLGGGLTKPLIMFNIFYLFIFDTDKEGQKE